MPGSVFDLLATVWLPRLERPPHPVKRFDELSRICKIEFIDKTEPFSAKQLGARLRSARETAGLSTRAVATALALRGIPVTHATLANYEKGVTFPSMATVRILASIYKRQVAWFLSLGPALTGMRYRSLKSVRVREKQQFEGNAAAWFQVYVELENILQMSPVSRTFTVRPNESPRQAAERMRRDELKLGNQPLPSVIKLLEQFGIKVIQVDSDARIDGFAAWFGSSPVVALNSTLANDRMRFNAGHELAHYLFDDCKSDAEETKENEKAAHEFASHLLIPQDVLKDALAGESMVRLVQFKEQYGVSLAAMLYRAQAGKIISDAMYERLMRAFGKLGWRRDEPGDVRPDRPRRLEELIELAVSQGRLTYGDAARLGGLEEAAVRQRVLSAMGGEASRFL